jgi:hypothetical protein
MYHCNIINEISFYFSSHSSLYECIYLKFLHDIREKLEFVFELIGQLNILSLSVCGGIEDSKFEISCSNIL